MINCADARDPSASRSGFEFDDVYDKIIITRARNFISGFDSVV